MNKFLKTTKQILSSVNKGNIDSGVDKTVELLEIEAIHTKMGNDPLRIVIEPADLSIENDVRISMSETATNFYGRAEGLATYSNTRRSISMSFIMIKSEVLNGSEAISNNALTANLLQQILYPAYMDTGTQNTSVIKTPPFFRIKYGDLVGSFKGNQRVGLPGYISRLNVRQGGGGWRGSIGENLGIGKGNVKLPISYRIDLGFNVLHEHVVGWYDGKFAGDGTLNWPLNTGIPESVTVAGPGGTGGNPGPNKEQTVVPGSPDAVVAAKVNKPPQGFHDHANDPKRPLHEH